MTILGTVSLFKEEILIGLTLTEHWLPTPDNNSLWNQPHKTPGQTELERNSITQTAQVCLESYVSE